MQSFSEAEKEAIRQEVKEQFKQLVHAIDQIDAGTWAAYYSKDGFLSTIAGTDFFAARSEWVDSISAHFSTRERQHIEPFDVRVTPLAPDLALMTSQEKTGIILKDGQDFRFKHIFTMIWKKEQDGWKIVHSHESWTDEQDV